MPSERKLLKRLKKTLKRLNRTKKVRPDKDPTRAHVPHISSSSDSDESIHSQAAETSDCNHSPDTVNAEEVMEIQEDPLQNFREALGDEYEDIQKFEGTIHTDIAKRWSHILINGLPKEEKTNILKKYKLPENCKVLAAPTLNEEVKSVMTDNPKTRDKSLELIQNQLGVSTTIIGQVMTSLITDEEINKVLLVTKLIDATKLLNDIHQHQTKTRRLLISPLLDKSFNNIIENVKRDEHLYGVDLSIKIKATQELKKSTLQIKKTFKPAATNIKQSGNRNGPPQVQHRQQPRATAPRGGLRNHTTQPSRPPRKGPNNPRPERAAQRGRFNRH